MQTATLTITGMHCGHCVMAVDQALRALPGVEDATVKVGSALVRYDADRATTAQLLAAVADAGYEVSAVA